MSGGLQRANPYVGPRAFRKGEPFFGRAREVRELFQLFVARRIVLLHAPSGAGKTSLVQAGLLPRLEEEDFHILPVARVNAEPPLGSADDLNRYVYSVLLSLQEDGEEVPQWLDEKLAELSLAQYLEAVADADEKELLVLVLDQFEEVLTTAPTDIGQKRRFFAQLGAALRQPYVWTLFVIREDYLGALEPYVRAVPTRLANTYRLGLLGIDSASRAIEKPAAGAGVDFTPDAVKKLVDDLRLMQVQRPDGTFQPEPGPHVEPVHLQVVCRRLWAVLPKDATTITVERVAEVGDVDQSLADYYAAHVREITAETDVPERDIRRWFHNKLMTRDEIRVPVLMGSDESADLLASGVIDRLVDAYLIRAEKRAGKTWLEVAHDRLVGPIRNDNVKWFEENLHLLQRQAELWKEDKPDYLLLREPQLEEAQEWVERHHRHLSENDRAFLRASQKERERREEEQESRDRQRRLEMEAASQRRLKRLLAGLLVVAAIAIIFLGTTVYSLTLAAERGEDAAVNSAIATAVGQTAAAEAVTRESVAVTGAAGGLAADPQAIAESTAAAATATAGVLQSELLVAEANATVRAGGASGDAAEATRSSLSGTATAYAAAAAPTVTPTADTGQDATITPTATARATSGAGQGETLPPEPLLYVSDREGSDAIYVMESPEEVRTNPDESVIELVSPSGYAWWPAWCGNGIVFEWGDDIWAPTSIEIAEVAGDGSGAFSALTSDQLPAGSAMNGTPSCSLDGRFLAFSSRSVDAAGNDFKVGRIDLQARAPTFDLLGDGYSLGGHVGWSPDNRRVVFMYYNSSVRRFDIYRMPWDDDAQPDNLTQALSASCKYPAWSPSGEQIAFTCSSGDSRIWSLYVYDSTASNAQPELLLSDLHVGSERYEQRQTVRHAVTPTWSPDGKWIAFSSDMDGDWDIYAYSLDTAELINLTANWERSNSDEIHPWWSR